MKKAIKRKQGLYLGIRVKILASRSRAVFFEIEGPKQVHCILCNRPTCQILSWADSPPSSKCQVIPISSRIDSLFFCAKGHADEIAVEIKYFWMIVHVRVLEYAVGVHKDYRIFRDPIAAVVLNLLCAYMWDSSREDRPKSVNLVCDRANIRDPLIVVQSWLSIGPNDTVDLLLAFFLNVWVVDQSEDIGLEERSGRFSSGIHHGPAQLDDLFTLHTKFILV